MSSRNKYLTASERPQAAAIHRALDAARAAAAAGESDAATLTARAASIINAQPLARIDYLDVVDAATFQPVARISRPAVLAAAVFFNATRLIDNIDLFPAGAQAQG